MIIDVHTHLGRNEKMNARVGDLLRSMDAARIDKALVFAGTINGCPTEDLLKEIAPHHDRLFGVVGVELSKMFTYDNESERFRNEHDPFYNQRLAEQLSQPNVVAAKFYLGYEHFMPDDPAIYQAMRMIKAADKTAIFHTGDCYRAIKNAKLKYAHPLGIDDVATDFPDTRIVIAHMGYPWHRDAAEVCYKNKNVFADVSGFVYGKFDDKQLASFERVVNEFIDVAGGHDRLLFGSDWPISDQSSYISTKDSALRDVWLGMMTNVERAFKL